MKTEENKETKICPTCRGQKTLEKPVETIFPGLLVGSISSTKTVPCTTCKGEGVVPMEPEKES